MTIPIYVINLERDTERLTSISKNLGSLGLEFERVPAVLGLIGSSCTVQCCGQTLCSVSVAAGGGGER